MLTNIVHTPVVVHSSSSNSYSAFYQCKNSEFIIRIKGETTITELEQRCEKKKLEAERKQFCEIKANRDQCSFWEVNGDKCISGGFVFIILILLAMLLMEC